MRINIQRLWAIISALNKPLHFAALDDFAHLHALKGLEAMASPLIDEAIAMGPIGEIRESFIALSEVIKGFDSASLDEKKMRLNKALSLTGPAMLRAVAAAALVNICDVQAPILELRGVGPKLAEKLKKKGLNTIFDLLFFLPRRFEDRTRLVRIRDLTAGESAQVVAVVAAAGEGGYGRRKIFEVVVDDGSALLHLKWFHYRGAYTKRFTPGKKLRVYGHVSRSGYSRAMEIIHPDIEFLNDKDTDAVVQEGIVGIYSEVEGVHQKTLRRIITETVKKYAPLAPGGVPPEVLTKNGLLDLPSALLEAHFPKKMPDVDKGAAAVPAMRALAFDELFLLESSLGIKRGEQRKERGLRSYYENKGGGLEGDLRSMLTFSLTKAQERVIREIKGDMAGSSPMNRLLEGDVGSGKTIVSLIAALLAVDCGLQAAVMAPTSLLAEQHYETINSFAARLGLRTCLLLGGMAAKERRGRIKEIREGKAQIIVGTHALIQKDVEFAALGLVVIDEQHRFGVKQRAELGRKGLDNRPPDVLVMTATPIPRTLSMTVFGNLEVSVLDELPPGRTPVKTSLIGETRRNKAYRLIRKEVDKGAQAYIVYPLVEESEELDLRDATREKVRLETEVFSGLRVALVHGRMSPADKDSVMRAFRDGDVDILVSTTVIEVGLDVPRATVMLIEHAERFGLAQLHQLRGRVGRGEREAYCLLMKNTFTGEDSFRRLRVMEETTDGFRIAEEDLKIRGPGDYLGERQSGLADFRFAWALMDYELVKAAKSAAEAFAAESKGLTRGAGPLVAAALKARWSDRLELAGIA